MLLSACQDDNKAADNSPTNLELVPDKVNTTDIDFAQALRTRHLATAGLAALGQRLASDARVKELATVINQVHIDEAKLLESWLTGWKGLAKSPATQPGVAEVMAYLEATPPGPAFDRAFLESLITQLDGSVPLAKRELESGSTVSALNLAERIVEEQPGEIEEMQGLLAELP